MPALAVLLTGLVVEFGGEGAAADARRIGLGDAEHEADRRGAEARARRGGAADGVRAGDEGIGAVIDVEQYALRALEQYAGAGLAPLLPPLPHPLPIFQHIVGDFRALGEHTPPAARRPP